MNDDYITLNDTLEEQLRRQLIDLNKQCRALEEENKMFKKDIAEKAVSCIQKMLAIN